MATCSVTLGARAPAFAPCHAARAVSVQRAGVIAAALEKKVSTMTGIYCCFALFRGMTSDTDAYRTPFDDQRRRPGDPSPLQPTALAPFAHRPWRARAEVPPPCLQINILVVGGGGREHALSWKLAQSESALAVYW